MPGAVEGRACRPHARLGFFAFWCSPPHTGHVLNGPSTTTGIDCRDIGPQRQSATNLNLLLLLQAPYIRVRGAICQSAALSTSDEQRVYLTPRMGYPESLLQWRAYLRFSSFLRAVKRADFLSPWRYLSGLDINMLSAFVKTGSCSTIA